MSATYVGLRPEDVSVLASRAISPEVAAQRGTRTVTAAEARQRGFPVAQARSGIDIPLHNTQGLVECHQIRPHHPRIDKDGKPRKYELAAGTRLIVDVPPASQHYIPDVRVPLAITESPLKGDAIQSGIEPGELCVADINGVWGWRSNKQPLSDFNDIPFCEVRHGRIVYRRPVEIYFDSDARTKPEVQRARREFTAFLRRKGADVRWIDLPHGPAGEKWGIDDVRAAGYAMADLRAGAYAAPADLSEPEPDPDDLDEVAQLRAKVATLETALRTERTLRMEEHAVLGDSSRPAQERICAVKLQWEARRVARHETIAAGSSSVVAIDETGAIHLNVKRLAEISGTSPKHAGACLKTWERQGWIRRSVTRHRVGTEEEITTAGEIKPRYESICRIQPRRDLDHMLEDFLTLPPRPPAEKPAPKPKPHCPEHPGADIIRRTTTTCSVCREEVQPERVSQHKVSDTALNEPEVISETTPVESAPSPGPHGLLPHQRLFQDEPAWLADAPEPEEDVIVYDPPSDLEPARNALADADRTGNRVTLEHLRQQLEPIAHARGWSPVPKPGHVAGDDVWTW